MAKFSEFIKRTYSHMGVLRNSPSHDRPAFVEADDILAQEANAAQANSPVRKMEISANRPRLQKLLPLTARIGFLGLTAIIMWWVWPRSISPTLSLASRGDELGQQNSATFAVVNPANRQGTEDPPASRTITGSAVAQEEEPSRDTWFQSIIVVTPTASSDAERLANSAVDQMPPTDSTPLTNSTQSGATENGDVESLLARVQEFAGLPTPVLIALEIPVAAASPGDETLPNLTSRSVDGQTTDGVPHALLVPTSTPQQVTASQTLQDIPRVEIVPAAGVKFTPIPEQTPAPTPTESPTPQPVFTVGPGRPWSTFAPLPPTQNDHFWIGNPFANSGVNKMASPNYQFGSTAGNRYRPHHGLDTSNPLGTPIQAAVTGEVVHAGPDDPDILGPYPDFYGKAVVIRLERRLPVAGGELDVFVLYGHMSEVQVEVGQRVQPEDVVGRVGMSGIAIGPHLHVEMRLGANTYGHSVNPYVWMQPEPGKGAVAIRVLTADGRTWSGAKISIARFDSGKAVWARQIETYLDTDTIGPDPAWGENGAMGDVPAGYYTLIGKVKGETLRAEFVVNAGQTSFVEIRTEQ